MTNVLSLPTRLVPLVNTIRFGMTVVGTLATFLPAAIVLSINRDSATAVDSAIVLVPLTSVGLAWVLLRGTWRVAITLVAGYAMLIGQFLFTSSNGPVWPPIASATFAVSVIAIGGLATPVAFASVVLSAVLCRIGVQYFPEHITLISTDLLNGWVTPLADVALGMAFLAIAYQGRKAAQEFDAQLDEIREESERARLETEVDQARRAVDRKLHETVLNTLMVLSTTTKPEAAQLTAARDLAILDSLGTQVPLDVRALTRMAADQVPDLEVRLDVNTDAQFPDERSAAIVRDSIVELLRNIQRHSGVLIAEVRVRETQNSVHIDVEDQGCGLPSIAPSGFGTEQSVIRPIESIGGSVRWTSAPNRGVLVQLSIPLKAHTETPTLESSLNVLLGTWRVRAAFNPTIALGVLAVPAAVSAFGDPWLILMFFVSQLVATLILVFSNSRQFIGIVRISAIAFAVATILAATSLDPVCSSAVEMHWIIFTAAGGIVLPVLLLATWLTRVASLLLVIGVSVFASIQYPYECLVDPLDAALENAGWVLILVALIGGMTAVVDRVRSIAEIELNEVAQGKAASAAAEAATARWRTISKETRSLIEEIASPSGPIDVSRTQATARIEQARMRSLLEVSRLRSRSVRNFWEDLIERAHVQGHHVSVRVSAGSISPPLDESMREGIERIGSNCSQGTIEFTILEDALLCSASCVNLPLLPQGWELLDITESGFRIFEYRP